MARNFASSDMAHGPIYKRIKNQLTERLASGEWKPNEAIPSETRLAQEFDVSIGTIRKAIDELVADKILVRQQGRGTFVAAHTQDRFLYHFFHVVNEDGTRRLPVTELLAFRKERADEGVARRLFLDRGARVVHFRNLLCIEGAPVEVNDVYLSADRFADFTRDLLANRPGTIYQLYQDHYGINVIRISERIRSAAAQHPEAQLLGLPGGAPVLAIERTAFTYGEAPVELRRSLVNTEHHVYLNEMAKQV